jgi:hypothetical protein
MVRKREESLISLQYNLARLALPDGLTPKVIELRIQSEALTAENIDKGLGRFVTKITKEAGDGRNSRWFPCETPLDGLSSAGP